MKTIIIIFMVLYGIHFFSEKQKRDELEEQGAVVPKHSLQTNNKSYDSAASTQSLKATSGTSSFSCDGRTHCSQMHSCEEATFFINNCPGTKMDGDNDGKPCEEQFCGH
jgi:hypothetical protein